MSLYKINGDAQEIRQDPADRSDSSGEMRNIIFLLANYKCEPARTGLPVMISVRMTLSKPAPSFEGMATEVTGKFGAEDGSFDAYSIFVPKILFRDKNYWHQPFAFIAGIIFGLIFIGVGIATLLSWPGAGGPWPIAAVFILIGLGIAGFATFRLIRDVLNE
ncbi:hypothetical protein LMG24238_04499 [Paraburkholderia sediminicola]|uniref:Uncharacterized protein n=1 Tax=Paraburkholderia sediminicola TaxID=458836 RepID=A0A6J5BSM4_9BURK|nr:hypothetical protein [Paraburkholderia sediminicola]CAB3715738.1 hypothetical protein LMG24238_04499 [Paraburkholderia sediminicola]